MSLEPELLRKLYWEDELGIPEIARKLGRSEGQIKYAFKKYKIPRRNRSQAQTIRRRRSHIPEGTLRHLYCEKHLSARQIAQRFGVSHHKILNDMEYFGIQRRSSMEAIRAHYRPPVFDEKNIQILADKGFSTGEIARHFHISRANLSRYAKRWGIQLPPQGQMNSNYYSSRRAPLTGPWKEILEGELLGDGCLRSRNCYTARFSYSTTRQHYLMWLKKELEACGLRCRQCGPYHASSLNGNLTYHLYSEFRPEFRLIYLNWYGNGKKHVPDNFHLTPRKLFHWFIGDGCVAGWRSGYPGVVLATCAFSDSDISKLRDELSKLGLISSLQKSDNVIYILHRSIKHFFEIVGLPPPEVALDYGYKWERAGYPLTTCELGGSEDD